MKKPLSRIGHSIRLVLDRLVFPHAGSLALVQGLSLLRLASGMLAAFALLPIMAMVSGVAPTGRVEVLLDVLTRVGAFFGVSGTLGISVFFLVLSVVFNGLISTCYNYAFYRLLSRFEFNKRMDIFRRYLKVDWLFAVNHRQGDVMNTLSTEVTTSRSLMSELMQLMDACVVFLGYLLVAFSVSWITSLSSLVVGGLFVLCFFSAMRKVKGFGIKTVEANRNVMQLLAEFSAGLKLVRSARMEEAAEILMMRQASKLRRMAKLAGFFKKLPETIGPLFVLSLIGFSLYVVHRFCAVDASEIALTGLLLMKGFKKLSTIQYKMMQMAHLWPSLLAVEQSSDAFAENRELSGDISVNQLEMLELDRVSFGYAEGQSVLHGISMAISRNEFVGIVGGSGSGKTTFMDLLIGLLRPSEGVLRINGIDLRDVDMSSWRKQIGYVPQDPIFFNDTVWNNITLYNRSVEPETVEWALKTAGAWEVVENLPSGLEEPIGDRGAKLSGGQRQRLSFARALAQKPSLLLLDEATSALDSQTEKEIQDSIMSMKGQVAVVAIAHRLSTVMKADRVVVLENGRIAESGSPSELLGRVDSLFSRMVKSQMNH